MSSQSKSFRLSSTLKIEEEAMVIIKNQGIGSILGSDISDERSTKSSSSLRRTLSADMSLTQQGFFSPMKKIASSEEFSICCNITDSSSSEGEDEDDEIRNQFDIWSSIQEEVCKKKQVDEKKQAGQFDIWSSIIQQKSQEITDNKPLPPPYIHPLVKRSASSLTVKSLEICTESLGSETGSGGFSSYPASESGDTEDDKETEQEPQEQQQQETVDQSFENSEEVYIPKYNYAAAGKKSRQRSFPPPISSLRDGASIRMQSRRENGRLVLEAVSVPSSNNFIAQRQNGHLVLTFAKTSLSPEITKIEQEEKREVQELEEGFESFDDEDVERDEAEEETDEEEEEEEGDENGRREVKGEEEGDENGRREAEEETDEEEEEEEGDENGRREVKEAAFAMEQAPKLSSRVINVHRLTLVGLANRDPTWPYKFNEVKFEEDIKRTIVAKSLSPMARLIPKPLVVAATGTVTAAATAGRGGAHSLNDYEYFWRPKPMTTQSKGDNNNNNKLILSNNNQEQQQLLVLRGNKWDCLVPLVNSCKEPRRSLLFLETYSIATS